MHSKTFFVISFFLFTAISSAQFIGGWHDTDSLKIGRDGHAGINLNNGYIMITGGYTEDDGDGTETTELFNTTTQGWEYGPPMNKGRARHHFLRLLNGNIIAIGGYREKTCEIFDIEDWRWYYIDSLEIERHWGGTTSTLLEDGNVLITGGSNWDSSFASCEIYDIDSNKWRLTNRLNISRDEHTATLLKNGKVLVTGGSTFNQAPRVNLKSCEIYDPLTETWSYTDSMKYPRANHSATLLPDGRILVVGGEQTICEIYNPVNQQWEEAGEVELAFGYITPIKISNDKYLLLIQDNSAIGGKLGWELFSLENFESVNSAAFTRKIGYKVSIRIDDNTVLATGGLERINIQYIPTDYCQIYDITTGIEEERKINQQNFKLKINSYPNPFNSSTNINIYLWRGDNISLSVYNLLGQGVSTIFSGYLPQGEHSFNYNPTEISTGIYFLRLETVRHSKTIKLIFQK